MHEIGTMKGRMAKKYSMNQVVICENNFISREEVAGVTVSRRVSGDQVFKTRYYNAFQQNVAAGGIAYFIL